MRCDGTYDQATETDHQNNITHIDPIIPDYYEISTAIQSLGFDAEKSSFPGFCVLCMRSDEVLKNKKKYNQSVYCIQEKTVE